MESIEWLNNWYKANCNGEWEQSYGVKIETISNPGWEFSVDLMDTPYEGKTLSKKNRVSDTDWYSISCDGVTFDAIGDASKLGVLIDLFRKFIETESVKSEDI